MHRACPSFVYIVHVLLLFNRKCFKKLTRGCEPTRTPRPYSISKLIHSSPPSIASVLFYHYPSLHLFSSPIDIVAYPGPSLSAPPSQHPISSSSPLATVRGRRPPPDEACGGRASPRLQARCVRPLPLTDVSPVLQSGGASLGGLPTDGVADPWRQLPWPRLP